MSEKKDIINGEQAGKPYSGPVDATKPVVKEKTHDNNLTSSKSSSNVGNKTMHAAEGEVRVLMRITSRSLHSFVGSSDTLFS